jgi:RNA recognition motif-containing protein
MATKLFVAGLDFGISNDEFRDMFADFGTVVSAQIVTDRDTNRSKGFGFIEMSSDQEGDAAIKGLNGKDVKGRALVVNAARPREDWPQRSFGGRSNGGNRSRSGGNGNGFRRSY